jgi:hypothetical protein
MTIPAKPIRSSRLPSEPVTGLFPSDPREQMVRLLLLKQTVSSLGAGEVTEWFFPSPIHFRTLSGWLAPDPAVTCRVVLEVPVAWVAGTGRRNRDRMRWFFRKDVIGYPLLSDGERHGSSRLTVFLVFDKGD